jgi:Rap1a immunity proteins
MAFLSIRTGMAFDMGRKAIAAISFSFLLQGGLVSGASATDQTVAQFLMACAETGVTWSDCSFAISILDLYDEFDPRGSHQSCPPRNPEMETAAVFGWLKDHPATYNMEEREGVLAALRALYPCRG